MAGKEGFWPLTVRVKSQYGETTEYRAVSFEPKFAMYLNDEQGKMPRYYYLNRDQVIKQKNSN